MIRRAKRGVEEAKLKGTWPHILEANIQHLQSQIAKSAKWIKTKSTKKAHKSGDVRMKGSIGVHWIASLKCIIYVCLLCCNVLFDLMPLFLCVPSLFLLSVLVLSCCPRFFFPLSVSRVCFVFFSSGFVILRAFAISPNPSKFFFYLVFSLFTLHQFRHPV